MNGFLRLGRTVRKVSTAESCFNVKLKTEQWRVVGVLLPAPSDGVSLRFWIGNGLHLHCTEAPATRQDLTSAVRKAEAEKTAAQQAVHELQLQMREVSAIKSSASRRTDLAPDDAKVHDLISAMEEHGIGELLVLLCMNGRTPGATPTSSLGQFGGRE